MITPSTARRIVLSLAAAWAGLNGLVYAADSARRYRAEAAWFIFTVVLIVAAVAALARGPRVAVARRSSLPRYLLWISLASSVGLAVALYFPMLWIGLLSDDFVLLARAQAGTLADPSWEYLRPLPLAVWRGLSGFGDTNTVPVLLHTFNVGLHGVNAWLTAVLAIRFGFPHRTALVAAIVFLVLPTSVEAVVWASGVFDVLLVTLTLAASIALLAARTSGPRTLIVAVLTAGALMTKETAVVLPALLVVSALCSPYVNLRAVAVPIAVSAGLVILYLSARLIAGFAAAPPAADLSGYALKEVFSRPFGTLGLPFHAEFLRSHLWVAFLFAAYWPALLLWSSVRWPNNRGNAMHALALGTWILISIAPAATLLFIADDLQGARYLYLGSVAWSILLVVLLGSFRESHRVWIIAPIVAIFAMATRAHQPPWSAAAIERDRVLAAYARSGLTCRPENARRLPDHIRGAYVFRNGFAEAIGSSTPSSRNSEPCVLDWDGGQFTRLPP